MTQLGTIGSFLTSEGKEHGCVLREHVSNGCILIDYISDNGTVIKNVMIPGA